MSHERTQRAHGRKPARSDVKKVNAPAPPVGGRAARDAAVAALVRVVRQGRAFDDLPGGAQLEPRDRAFARAIVAAALRHRGSLMAVIGRFLDKGLPKDGGSLEAILLSAAAQLLILETPPHAAISLAVDQTRADRTARRFDKLSNAVLRRVSEQGAGILATFDIARLDIPGWMLAGWERAYGRDTALEIARASLREAPLDLSVKSDPEGWAARLGGIVLPTGSVRVAAGGRIEDIEGYRDGEWWVQDAAAALPVKLLGDVKGLSVADLCAAPGGKTAQLAALGADVVAVEQSPVRLERLQDNLARLGLKADTATADATSWSPSHAFDAILVDAPCTATGTLRRHPDILHLKRADDIAQLAKVQAAILAAAAKAVKPGGRLVYCTCSLEPQEGREQIERFLQLNRDFARLAVVPAMVGGLSELIDANGDLRTLPHHLGGLPEGLKGLDGFYACVLERPR